MDTIVNIVSVLAFFLVYFGLNILINNLRRSNKGKKTNKEILKSSILVSLLYLVLMLIMQRMS